MGAGAHILISSFRNDAGRPLAITTLDGWISATKQQVEWIKTTTRTTVAGGWFSMFDIAGSPGAGTLAIGNTANGVVPTDATNGYPVITAASATKYLSAVEYASTVASRLRLFDRVFACGAYAFNANTALSSQPSYAGRLPGTVYSGLEIWVEQVTTATGNQAVNVTYTDQDGNTGATTGAVGIAAAPTVGRCWQLPLAAGDSGLQVVTNVTGTVASAGTFNVMVLRPLKTFKVRFAGDGDTHDLLKTGLKQIFTDSALYALVNAEAGTSSGLPQLSIDIADG
jgi:hypothetical protein